MTDLKVEDIPGVGSATAEKLAAGGFDTLLSIAVTTPAQLVNAAGVTESAGRKMIQAARSMLDMGFQTGEEILDKRSKVKKLRKAP